MAIDLCDMFAMMCALSHASMRLWSLYTTMHIGANSLPGAVPQGACGARHALLLTCRGEVYSWCALPIAWQHF